MRVETLTHQFNVTGGTTIPQKSHPLPPTFTRVMDSASQLTSMLRPIYLDLFDRRLVLSGRSIHFRGVMVLLTAVSLPVVKDAALPLVKAPPAEGTRVINGILTHIETRRGRTHPGRARKVGCPRYSGKLSQAHLRRCHVNLNVCSVAGDWHNHHRNRSQPAIGARCRGSARGFRGNPEGRRKPCVCFLLGMPIP